MSDEKTNTGSSQKNGEKLKEALTHAFDLPPEEQKKLNEPLKDPSGMTEADHAFLDDVISKLEKGKINLYSPSSLINQDVYKGLSDEVQGKIDLNAVNLLARLREIKGLYDSKRTDSYQFENLVEQVRLTKESLEDDAGDVFII